MFGKRVRFEVVADNREIFLGDELSHRIPGNDFVCSQDAIQRRQPI
jgi:hypothetical protein